MRITKVYTRTGDRGTTRLVDGQEIRKDHPRIDAYGLVDELNAVIGLVQTFNVLEGSNSEALNPMLREVQNDLFCLGGDLATPPAARWEGMVRLTEADVTRLEQWIDTLNADLAPLEEFILPGGGLVGAHFHQARTVCRRVERRLVHLVEVAPDTGTVPVQYLNRLSDWLFVAGRWAAKQLDQPELQWKRS